MGLLKRIICLSFIAGLALSALSRPAAAAADYIRSPEGEKISIPKTYTLAAVYSDFGDAGTLNTPRDLFIDETDNVYISDTGNNRILKINRNGKLLGEYTGPAEKPLRQPGGTFVDGDGDIFIADTGGSRVLHLSPDGAFVEEFENPKSELLPEDFQFQPDKLAVNRIGNIAVLKRDAFFMLDGNNEFQGYLGANSVEFQLWRVLVRIFGTKTQRERIVKSQPYSYSNFLIHSDGMIYAVSPDIEKDQIMKITSVGTNVFPSGVYGEQTVTGDGKVKASSFTDLAVDAGGVISAVDTVSGKIFQYSPNGKLLTVFGGLGEIKGTFAVPSSIAADSAGRLYLLDAARNNIQVFEPTAFIRIVHRAVIKYNEGDYNAARESWKQVLEIDENYQLAHTGLGDAYLKEENWQKALEEYILADNTPGYSDAFAQLRREFFRAHFGACVLAGAAVLVLLIFLFMIAKRYAEKRPVFKRRGGVR